MSDLLDIQKQHIGLMKKTAETLGHILSLVSEEDAITLRDGPEGWTILEILCHLRDFDVIFRNRAHQMLTEVNPQLPAYDHETMAVERAYNNEDFRAAYTGYSQSRIETVAFFEQLTPDQWQRVGVHPERGDFTMTDAVIQVGHHDVTHIEQITRVLTQKAPTTSS